MIKKIFIRIILPMLISILLDTVGNKGVNENTLLGIIEHLSKLSYYIALIGAGSIFFEEVLKDSLVPVIEKTLNDTASKIVYVIKEKQGALVQVNFRDHIDYKKDSFIEYINSLKTNDPELDQVKEILLSGSVFEAINMLRDMVKKKPTYQNYQTYLLTALIYSKNHSNIREAESMLPKYGNAQHYHRLAYQYWIFGDIIKAIELEEKAFELAQSMKYPDTEIKKIYFKNSLAYYYADAEREDKAELATKFAEEFFSKGEETERYVYAECLDTLGYVKITFGKTKDEVQEGIKNCEDARRLGVSETLYFKHLNRAQEKLRDFL